MKSEESRLLYNQMCHFRQVWYAMVSVVIFISLADHPNEPACSGSLSCQAIQLGSVLFVYSMFLIDLSLRYIHTFLVKVV